MINEKFHCFVFTLLPPRYHIACVCILAKFKDLVYFVLVWLQLFIIRENSSEPQVNYIKH